MKIEEDLIMKRKKQGNDSRLDESLGERRGPEKMFYQSMKARRDESKGMRKNHDESSYGREHDMDEDDKVRMRHHMMVAHHKFMAQHHRRRMHKK